MPRLRQSRRPRATKKGGGEYVKRYGRLFYVVESESIARAAKDAMAPPHADECVCTICTCGRHECKCPPKGKDWDRDATSSYLADYVEHPLPTRRPPRPAEPATIRHVDPNHFDSTSRRDFDHKPILTEYPRPHSPTLPTRAFEGTSEHRAEYTPVRSFPERVGRHREAPAPTAPFVANSTHREDFVPLPLEPRAEVDHGGDVAPSRPFDATTEHRAEYHPHPLGRFERVRPARPRQGLVQYPTELTSGYRHDYVRHPLDICPVFGLSPPPLGVGASGWHASAAVHGPSEPTGHTHYIERVARPPHAPKQTNPAAFLPAVAVRAPTAAAALAETSQARGRSPARGPAAAAAAARGASVSLSVSGSGRRPVTPPLPPLSR